MTPHTRARVHTHIHTLSDRLVTSSGLTGQTECSPNGSLLLLETLPLPAPAFKVFPNLFDFLKVVVTPNTVYHVSLAAGI